MAKPNTSSSSAPSCKKRGRKRKQKQSSSAHPTRLIDNESIEVVASPLGPIRTPVASTDDKNIIIDRLKKEIVNKFDLTLSKRSCDRQRDGSVMLGGKIGADDDNNQPADEGNKKRKKRKTSATRDNTETTLADIIKARLITGTNQCTRTLEGSLNGGTKPKPSLVLLSRDVRPPTILAHVPLICQRMGVPSLVLPGRASSELGRALGAKCVAVAVFLPSSTAEATAGQGAADIRECNRCLDSYVKFALSKVPPTNSK